MKGVNGVTGVYGNTTAAAAHTHIQTFCFQVHTQQAALVHKAVIIDVMVN